MVTRMGDREISVVSGRVGMYAVFSLDSGFKIQSWFKIHVSARKRKKGSGQISFSWNLAMVFVF